MAFIDADEFIIIKDGTADLPTLLQDYWKFGGLGVFWVVFGSSGHINRPAAGALGSYYMCGIGSASVHCTLCAQGAHFRTGRLHSCHLQSRFDKTEGITA